MPTMRRTMCRGRTLNWVMITVRRPSSAIRPGLGPPRSRVGISRVVRARHRPLSIVSCGASWVWSSGVNTQQQ